MHNHPVSMPNDLDDLILMKAFENKGGTNNSPRDGIKLNEQIMVPTRFQPFCLDKSHAHYSKNIYPNCHECQQSMKSQSSNDKALEQNHMNMM